MELTRNVMIGLLLLFFVIFILYKPSRTKEHASFAENMLQQMIKNQKPNFTVNEIPVNPTYPIPITSSPPVNNDLKAGRVLLRGEGDFLRILTENRENPGNLLVSGTIHSVGNISSSGLIHSGSNISASGKLCLDNICIDKNHLGAIGKSWIDKGCWKDDQTRVIPNSISQPNMTLDECKKYALANGANILGMQNGNECYIGKDSQYDKLGSVASCNLQGDAWVNRVYRLE
jgi:hypothetical protein